ncbi:MAG: beta-exotoxin transport system ATP-binding protein [Thermotogota bacterium]|nr:beta-exotoxin transport system ATP-binding protein [Thermotogota bacterium]MDK2865452.1 beta-exotoxin transport system ATP-binding protein [Thermotogota bacterium]HCZ07449.1 ABC transporter [Thermotogota bacterium]
MEAITVENLTKYYGKNRGIEGVNLSVPEGEIFGFIGPNGAGKTTTIRLLLGLIFPTSGKASIFGKDCIKYGKEIRKEVGYIPGEVNFYPDATVEDFLKYAASFYENVDEEYTRMLCKELSVETKKKFRELSMGNKKKVAVVQALMHRPKLLILDEPTNGLDPLIQKLLFEFLKEEKERGATVFFSSHILSEVERLCDRVAMIKDGRIFKVEKIDDLRKERYKVVRVRPKNPEVLKEIVSNTTEEGNGVFRFMYTGSTNELLQKLSRIEIEDLWIDDPSLEEIFMSYYREGKS